MGFVIFLIGALTNRFIRGGNTAKKLERYLISIFPKYEKIINFVVSADFLNALIFFFTFVWFYGVHAIYLTIAMWIGGAPTWGQYMQALNREYHKKFNRNIIFDYFPNKINSVFWGGFLGMTLRGAFWGGLLAITSLSIAPLFVGLFMGVIYLLAAKLSEKINKIIFIYFAEILFGGLLWLSLLM